MTPGKSRCYTITDENGKVVASVRADKPPTDEAIAAFRELAQVVQKQEAEHTRDHLSDVEGCPFCRARRGRRQR